MGPELKINPRKIYSNLRTAGYLKTSSKEIVSKIFHFNFLVFGGWGGGMFSYHKHFEIPHWCKILSIFDYQKVMVMSEDISEKTKKIVIKINQNTRRL